MVPKLSVVVNAYNEAKSLPVLLTSIKDLAFEIVIVDMESVDNTKDVAKKFKANVFSHKHLSYVEAARNFGISKATGDWVLIMDPDEEVPESLANEIKSIMEKDQADYYRISRKNIIFNRWMKHSRWWPDYNIRLFKRGFVSWNEIIHAVPMTQGKGGEILASEDLAIIHHHYDSIEQYIERMNRYTSQQAKLKILENYKFSWKDLLTRPVDEFLSRYFFGQGYKDGVHGLAIALLQGFSELVLYLKVWQASEFKEDNLNAAEVISQMKVKEKDLHFWQNDVLYKETNSLIARIKRKFKI
jgi:(heptosyl)LPS beta-1,4-glucosyltransferase